MLAFAGKCFDSCLSPAAVEAQETLLDRDGAKEALKMLGLPNGSKDLERLAATPVLQCLLCALCARP